jgi:16S rRNA processing protein RimM
MVARAHGLDGSFYVVRPSSALEADVLTVAGTERRVVRRAGTPSRPILRLEGIEGREAAEALRGQELFAPRTVLGDLESDEYWAEDLVGCRVSDGDWAVGVVSRLLAYPSCELLEVERDAGGKPLLIPLVRDAVRSVDPQARAIDVDLGFLGEGG